MYTSKNQTENIENKQKQWQTGRRAEYKGNKHDESKRGILSRYQTLIEKKYALIFNFGSNTQT